LGIGMPPVAPVPWLPPHALFVIPALLIGPAAEPDDMPDIESAPPAVLPAVLYWGCLFIALLVQPAPASARPPANGCCRPAGLLQQLHPVMRMPTPHNPTQPIKGFLPIGLPSPM
jgi:hypothetical protein